MDNLQPSNNHPVEWLKASRGNLINNLHYQLGYDEDSDGIYMADTGGVFITRLAFEFLIADVRKFFAYHGDLGIAQLNAEIVERREQEWQDMLHPQANPEIKTSATSRTAVGYVYLIWAENGLYKIGKALNVGVRLQSLAAAIPMEWKLIHSFRSANHSSAEIELHKKFAEKREVGEWFRLSPEEVTYIQSLRDFDLDSNIESLEE